jgi:hypothetical protein
VVRLGDGRETGVTFGRIVGVGLLPSGRVVVADASEQQVRTFDSIGRVESRWGRPGSGPGEFRNLAGIAVTPESLFAFESAPGPSRRHARDIVSGDVTQSEVRDSVGRLRAIARFSDGALLVARDGFRAVSPPPLGTAVRDTIELGILSAGGQQPHAWIRGVPNNSWVSYRVASDGASLAMTRQPLGASLVTTAAGRHAWIGDTQSGVIRIFGMDGTMLREVTLPGERRSLIASELARLRALEMQKATNDAARDRVEAQFDARTAPSLLPAFRRMVASADSLVWVDAGAAAGTDSSEAIVFTSSGQLVARVRLPANFVVWHADHAAVAGVLTDEDGAESVVVYRVKRGAVQ